MCQKGSPSTTTAQNQVANSSTASNTQGEQTQAGFSQLGPNPDTLALYQQFLAHTGAVANAPFDTNMMQQTVPWTAGQDAASNYQIGLGMQGMPYTADAANLLNQGSQSTIGQIPGVAASIISPWAGQAVNYGQQQGQAIGNWGTSRGDAISNYATNLAAQGPQLQQFSQGAIDQYMSPYINDVVNATQNQFTNANAQQGNVLLGQGIRTGNAFGGDRAGVAAAQLGNQQQLAQAPVIAGLYNTGYNTALSEFNTQNQLAAQLGQMAIQGQVAGGQLGLQGLTAGGQLGMQGLGLGLQASTAANSVAAQALAQNQNAQLQAGNMLGNLGALSYSQNLAGGAQANQAAAIYPAYLQNLYGTQAANAQMAAAYPFQTSSWYGGLLQGIGGLTGTQQSNVNSALSNYLQNQQGTQVTNGTGTTTPPQPNSFLQAAGLGLAGLGLFAKRGGSVPRRAGGGMVPRMAAGGRPGGPANFLQSPFASELDIRPLQPTHLAAPNTSATDIKLPTLSALTFPGMSTPNASAPSGSVTGATQGLIGQATSLLGNKQVASGIKSIGSSLFGDNNVDVAVSDSTGFGGGSPAGDLPTQAKRGGHIGYRSGGAVAMHYDDGGDVESPDAQDIINDDFDALNSSNEGPPVPGVASTNWVDSMISGMGLPNGDSDVPMPQRRPAEADAPPANEAPDTWTAPEGSGGQPEAANVGLPELANDLPVPEAMTAAAQGQPERQAGIGPARPQRGGGGGGGGPRRIDFPGMQARPPGILERWAANPLTQLGLGLASARGPGLTGVAEGLAMGLNRVQAQKIANDKLDQNYKLDTSGKTLRVVYNNHAIDTTLPTRWADNETKVAQQGRGRAPTGMQYNAEGKLERVPYAEGQGPKGKPETLDQAAARRFLEANPDATPEDIAAFKATLKGKAGAAGKPIPSPAQKDLATAGSSIQELDVLTSSFKPDYGGFYSQTIGDLANTAGRAGVAGEGRKQAAEWWQTYDRYKADVRHGKFGASLTAGEKEAWNQLDVHPGMAPDAIAKNMEQQDRIIAGGALRKAKSLIAQGFSQEAVEAQLGVSIESLGERVARASKPGEPIKKKEDAAGGAAQGTPAAAPGAPPAPETKAKREPTQEDINYVKAHPEKREKFIKTFGREP